ncbi:hypothetical protein [Agrococcus jejuensis]|uniref:Lipoprotein n=1 Tax=Agrococcus jejuensis TaxID=399736 RepID=A0A1G8C3C0_9MICO|nr:hypothetical protein [Agrococcus jejuensis]SDH39460.1 hypothetical protein SAMN04489720_1136 [Agrococcus jejuensis]
MRRIRFAPLAAIAIAAVALAGCTTTDADADASTAPSTSPSTSPSASATPEPSATEEPWQTVELEDGTTWSMPADWTTTDTSVENQVGRVLQVDVADADGATVLSYSHDLGGVGGIGGACDTYPAVETFASEPSQAGFAPLGEEAFVDAAYAVEQPDGSVVLTVGVVPDTAFDDALPRCLVYNIGQHPADGRTVSFATAFQSGVDPDAAGSEQPWGFASFPDAQAYVESAEGQQLLQVVQSLRLRA